MVFITLVTMIREGVEDISRHRSDRESNNSDCVRIKDNKAETAKWRDLKVGELILVRKDTRIPADLIMLASDKEDGAGFMETSTLDGEKNLKPRGCLKETLASVQNKIEWVNDELTGAIDIDLEIKISVQ